MQLISYYQKNRTMAGIRWCKARFKRSYFNNFRTLLCLSVFLVPFISSAQQFLLALSKTDHTLAIVDASTLKVLAKMPVGSDPHEVVASSDGKTAYVSIYGGGSMHELNILDLVAQKPLKNVDTRPLMGPHGLVFVGGKAWFSAEGSKAVGRYDPATDKLDWSMGTGQDRTHMIYVTSDEKKVYTTNVSSASVSILELASLPPPRTPSGAAIPGAQGRTDWMQTIIPVAKGSEGFDVSPNGQEIWTAGAGDGNISIIDIPAKKLKATLDGKIMSANRLKFTPDGKLVLVSCLGNGNLFVFDAAERKLLKQIPIGHGAAGIEMDPQGGRAFVACTPDNYVAIIDLKTLQVSGHLDVGGGPDGLAWAVRQ